MNVFLFFKDSYYERTGEYKYLIEDNYPIEHYKYFLLWYDSDDIFNDHYSYCIYWNDILELCQKHKDIWFEDYLLHKII